MSGENPKRCLLFSEVEAIRLCEGGIWRGLAETVREASQWPFSAITRAALERVLVVMNEQVARTSGEAGERQWKQ